MVLIGVDLLLSCMYPVGGELLEPPYPSGVRVLDPNPLPYLSPGEFPALAIPVPAPGCSEGSEGDFAPLNPYIAYASRHPVAREMEHNARVPVHE